MKMFKKLIRAGKQLYRHLDPLEKEFESVYPMIDKVPGFLKSPQQERWFFRAAKKAPANAVIVEIGSFKGRSTVSFGFGCLGTQKHIFAIDLFEGDGKDYGQGNFQKVFQENVERCGLTDYVTPIKKHSVAVAKAWEIPIDILFIDGSHEYQDVKADFEAFFPHVKKNGIVAFHDIKGKWVGVIQFWNEVLSVNYLKNIGTVSSLGFGLKK